MLKESYYIEKFNTLIPHGYNINPNGGNFSNNKLSEETKRKMSQSHKGKKHNEETKEKLRQINLGKEPSNKGMAMSIEQKFKLSSSLKGGEPSESTRKKLSMAKLGNTNTKGMTWTDETKKKISESVSKSLKDKYKRIKEIPEIHTSSYQ